ncbi:uncharacterized protein Ecym_8311 [Eremothecium cymbalariae DBVPG|uniref:Uncharacterized protein n=1 Tax=Eremothecium cymbalariae (strain CBS 270.75 / DBVPG 7215 / KCTC 17166 / NRRL Y-17582) TaxID=931890 RepID=G8JXL5_ERECY|nr:Hypothetical protein Ecym_8311 [Eremothecium cymbalariae DBVPG\
MVIVTGNPKQDKSSNQVTLGPVGKLRITRHANCSSPFRYEQASNNEEDTICKEFNFMLINRISQTPDSTSSSPASTAESDWDSTKACASASFLSDEDSDDEDVHYLFNSFNNNPINSGSETDDDLNLLTFHHFQNYESFSADYEYDD